MRLAYSMIPVHSCGASEEASGREVYQRGSYYGTETHHFVGGGPRGQWSEPEQKKTLQVHLSRTPEMGRIVVLPIVSGMFPEADTSPRPRLALIH